LTPDNIPSMPETEAGTGTALAKLPCMVCARIPDVVEAVRNAGVEEFFDTSLETQAEVSREHTDCQGTGLRFPSLSRPCLGTHIRDRGPNYISDQLTCLNGSLVDKDGAEVGKCSGCRGTGRVQKAVTLGAIDAECERLGWSISSGAHRKTGGEYLYRASVYKPHYSTGRHLATGNSRLLAHMRALMLASELGVNDG
tara:strand:+ start:96 stop:686 length:591 start_codon:yes stop_codon:yes gene_type:complete